MGQLTNHASEVRQSLNDPMRLCEKLGWLDRTHKRQARGVMICCPSHGEKDPSCSVRLGSDGTIQLKCHACQWSGDALTMVAFAHSMDLRGEFQEVLAIGAELAGNLGLADEIRGRELSPEERRARPRLAAPAVSTLPPPEYPSEDSLARLWRSCVDPSTDAEVVKMLHGRGIDFGAVSDLRLARVIPPGTELPWWASRKGDMPERKSWIELGNRLLIPSFDHCGKMRSVRAWRVCDGDTPKRLPPAGCKGSELVQANRLALLMLRRWVCPLRLFIVEGEPDFLVTATTFARGDAVIGIGSGSWTEDFAKRVPLKTRIYVATHADKAGDIYAEKIIETLHERHLTWRLRPAA